MTEGLKASIMKAQVASANSSQRPPSRSDTYGLPGGGPVGLVATCQSLRLGSGEAEGEREVRVDVVCVETAREAMPARWVGAARDAQGDLD